MPFATAIQALLGPNTPDNGSNVQCAPDWANMRDYIYGPHPTLGPLTIYLASQNMNTGAEIASANATGYLGGNAFHEYPVGRDTAGNIYVVNLGAPSSGLIAQIDPVTLAQTHQGNLGFAASQGCISGILSGDGSQWILVSGLGGQVSFEKHACFNITGLGEWTPGAIAWGNRQGVSCPGKYGTGVGFEVVGPELPTDPSQVLDLHKCMVTIASQTDTVLGHVHPTDIDAAWTVIICSGCCVDQTDGHVLVALQGQSAAAHPNYLAKLSSVDASVIWKTIMPNDAGGPEGGNMMQFSLVQYQRYNWISNQGGGAGIEQTFVNTATGAIVDQYTAGLSNVLLDPGGTASNDVLGTVLGNFNKSAGAGGPTLLNTTPGAFIGWALLYVEPGSSPPAAPSGPPWFGILGPARPRGALPPPAGEDITTEATIDITTEGGGNITTE